MIDGDNIAAAICGVFLLLIVCIVVLGWWSRGLRQQPPPQRIEAELLDAPAAERRCVACKTTASASGWRRPAEMEVMGGVVGWTRRVRGLPPLYTRVRPAFAPEALCAGCSHTRDCMVDEKITEMNLAVYTIGKKIAQEVQRFSVSLPEELEACVTPADPRKRKAMPTQSSGLLGKGN